MLPGLRLMAQRGVTPARAAPVLLGRGLGRWDGSSPALATHVVGQRAPCAGPCRPLCRCYAAEVRAQPLVLSRDDDREEEERLLEPPRAATAVLHQELLAPELVPPPAADLVPQPPPSPPDVNQQQSVTQRLVALAAPLIFHNVVGYAVGIINLAYVGALGAQTLSAFVLASSIYNVCGLSVALGLSTGMDTLAGSAFGAKEYGKLGLILQRAVLVCWGACIPVAIGWLNADHLLRALGQDPAISDTACKFLVLWIPCLFLNVFSECIKRFLQAQRQVKPMAVTGAVAVALAPMWYHLFMRVLNMGVEGSALASAMIQFNILLGVLGYSLWYCRKLGDQPEQPWRGLQLRAAASGWREYLSYGLPAAAMICLEWWVFEAVVIMSGWIPDGGVALACTGICTSLNAWAYMIPLGLAAAVNTSVSNALGAGDGHAAKHIFRTGMRLAVGLQAFIAAGLLTGGPALVSVLCPDPSVRELTLKVLPVLAGVVVCDGLNAVVAGVLRGAGRQKLGAVVNAACCALAIPTAGALAFNTGLGASGFWMGVGAGAASQLVLLLGVLARARGGAVPGSPAAVKAAADAALAAPQPAKWWTWNWDHEAARLKGVALQPSGH